MVHRLPFAPLLEQNDCHFAQSKGFPSRRPVSTRGDDFMQHPLERGTYQLGRASRALAPIGRDHDNRNPGLTSGLLATAEGCSTAAPPRSWRWQARFMAEAHRGTDAPSNPGKPPLPAGTVQSVVDLALGPPPGETTHWTGRDAGESRRGEPASGATYSQGPPTRAASHPHVQAVERPAEKLKDVVGLYVDPPAHAIVALASAQALPLRGALEDESNMLPSIVACHDKFSGTKVPIGSFTRDGAEASRRHHDDVTSCWPWSNARVDTVACCLGLDALRRPAKRASARPILSINLLFSFLMLDQGQAHGRSISKGERGIAPSPFRRFGRRNPRADD